MHDANVIKEMTHLVNDASVPNRLADLSAWKKLFCSLKTVPAMKESLDFLWRTCNIECGRLSRLVVSLVQHVKSHPATVSIFTYVFLYASFSILPNVLSISIFSPEAMA